MADVDMTDAPVTSGSATASKKVASKTKAGDGGADGKKRFEVKKVRAPVSRRRINADICASGMRSLCGPGILSSTTALFAEITSWTYVCLHLDSR